MPKPTDGNPLGFNTVTYLCVPIFVTDLIKARRDIATAVEAGADLIELRMDRLKHAGELPSYFQNRVDVPFIITCRPEWEGGHSELEDQFRIRFLQEAKGLGAKLFDIELKTILANSMAVEELRSGAGQMIVSSHDFTGRPDKLYKIITEMNASAADVNKIVWTARTIRDNIEAFEILQNRHRPTISLCMGEAGLISRVLAKKFGAYLTFAALDSDSATAPGQISISEMKDHYRWDQINSKTRVYGVVANPVAHSMSPAIHNAAFTAKNFDGVYLPMLVESSYESFKAFMETFLEFKPLDLSGLSVTIPHKENALKYLVKKWAEVEPLASRIGAVNTIAIDNGQLRGFNTDYAAIIDSITSRLGIDRAGLKGLRISVVGAGGTGRTAVAALTHFGATVGVCNRTHDRAKSLADEFGAVASSLDELSVAEVDVVINTTSIGMHPNIDANPVPDLRINPKMVVFDAVYNPRNTTFLKKAKAAGARTINGIEMFVRQAAAQFEIWTKLPAPRDVMRKVVEDRLANQ